MRKKAKRIDWNEAERYYIYSRDVNYKQVAEYFDVSEASVALHGKEGNWVEKREEVQSRLKDKRFERVLTEELQSELNIEDAAILACNTLTDVILKIASRVTESAFNSDIDDIKADKLLNTLASIVNALERVVKTISLLRGGPTDRTEYTLLDLLKQSSVD